MVQELYSSLDPKMVPDTNWEKVPLYNSISTSACIENVCVSVSYLKPLLSCQGLCGGGEPSGATGHQAGGAGAPHHVPAGGGRNLSVWEQAGQQTLQV